MNQKWNALKLPLAVTLLSIVILTLFIGKKHGYTVDANASFAITQAMAATGNPFPETAVKQGYLYSIIYLPFYFLAQPLHVLLPDVPLEHLQRKMLCWMNTVFAALTAGVMCRLLRTLGYSKLVQSVLPLFFVFSTLAFTYARYDYNKSLAMFLLLSCLHFIITYLINQNKSRLLFSGLFLAVLVCIRLEMGIIVLPFLYALFQNKSLKSSAFLLVPFSFGVLFVFGYNVIYWQAELSGGYEGSFTLNPIPAIAGVLFSPGKSLFVFNPALLLVPLTIRFFWQRHATPVKTAWLGTVGILFFLYCFWGNWWGGWGYGARHFMPLIPLMMLPLAECFLGEGRRLLIPLLVLAGIGVIVQFVGAAIAFHDVINTLMRNGFTEQQLIWEPLLIPVFQHVRFMQAIPLPNWDFAVVSLYNHHPPIVAFMVISIAIALSGVLIFWIYKQITNESDNIE